MQRVTQQAAPVDLTPGTPLKVALATTGMTVRELARRIHRSENSVSRWVNDRRIPDALVKHAIARELNTTVDELWPEEKVAA